MSEEANKLREKIAKGEFRFADTLRLKHLQKVEALKEAKELLVEQRWLELEMVEEMMVLLVSGGLVVYELRSQA